MSEPKYCDECGLIDDCNCPNAVMTAYKSLKDADEWDTRFKQDLETMLMLLMLGYRPINLPTDGDTAVTLEYRPLPRYRPPR